jgi:hypothetical protein
MVSRRGSGHGSVEGLNAFLKKKESEAQQVQAEKLPKLVRTQARLRKPHRPTEGCHQGVWAQLA